MLQFRFSLKVTLICGVLSLLMIRASVWQWHRHIEKQRYIAELSQHLQLPPVPLLSLIPEGSANWESLYHRRVTVSGTYDFSHEIILRNRRYKGNAGVHAITPLKIDHSETRVLIDRGFIPLSDSGPERRKRFQKTDHVQLTAIVKESMRKKLFAPSDLPSNDEVSRIDAWLRIDVPNISKQIPYEILPVYLEIMAVDDVVAAESEIVESGPDGRDDIFMAPQSGIVKSLGMDAPDLSYPIPMFNKIIPPGRHLGYVFEWALMALITILIGLILQLRRPKWGEGNRSAI